MSEFEVLEIEKDGKGPYHANQFRIYFHVDDISHARDPTALVEDFIENFPGYFNPGNIAKVVRETAHQHNGKPILRFRLDAKLLLGLVEFFDFHDDWVGEVWRDPHRGFAVNTLAKKFTAYDELMASEGVGKYYVPPSTATAAATIEFNRRHFLAGRRSWIIRQFLPVNKGQLETSRQDGDEYVFVYSPVLMLETAALERYSSGFYQLLSHDKLGLTLNSLTRSVKTIWSRLLENYCHQRGYRIANPEDGQAWDLRLGNVRVNLRMDLCAVTDPTAPWMYDMLTMHPGLAALGGICVP